MEPQYTKPLGNCFEAHRKLVMAANELSRELARAHPDADLLRLGATCVRIGAEKALQAPDPQTRLRSWRECTLGERQIRLVTYRALRDGCIDEAKYDQMFRLASEAARIREDERQRQRRAMQYQNIV